MKNKPDNGGFASVEEVKFYVRRCKGLGLLDLDDTVEDALEDNEFVEVGKQSHKQYIAERLALACESADCDSVCLKLCLR